MPTGEAALAVRYTKQEEAMAVSTSPRTGYLPFMSRYIRGCL
jgi:hypothetical protein